MNYKLQQQQQQREDSFLFEAMRLLAVERCFSLEINSHLNLFLKGIFCIIIITRITGLRVICSGTIPISLPPAHAWPSLLPRGNCYLPQVGM